MMSSTYSESTDLDHCEIATRVFVDDACFVERNFKVRHTSCLSAFDFFYYSHTPGAVFPILFCMCETMCVTEASPGPSPN